ERPSPEAIQARLRPPGGTARPESDARRPDERHSQGRARCPEPAYVYTCLCCNGPEFAHRHLRNRAVQGGVSIPSWVAGPAQYPDERTHTKAFHLVSERNTWAESVRFRRGTQQVPVQTDLARRVPHRPAAEKLRARSDHRNPFPRPGAASLHKPYRPRAWLRKSW